MIRLFALLTMAACVGLAQQNLPVSGTISGALTGEDGTAVAGGMISLHLARPAPPKILRQQTDWTDVSATGGAFQFAGLPEGNYTVCPHVPNSTWLGPCEWNFPTPTATISRSNPNATIAITLERGVAVPIRINDAGQLMLNHDGKTPGAGMLLNVSGPGFFSRIVPLVSQDSSGRNYQVVVPFNTAVTLVVHPSLYNVNNAAGAALSKTASTKIPLVVATGQQVSPITFTISGIGQ